MPSGRCRYRKLIAECLSKTRDGCSLICLSFSVPQNCQISPLDILKLFLNSNTPYPVSFPEFASLLSDFPLPTIRISQLAAISEKISATGVAFVDALRPISPSFPFDPRLLKLYISAFPHTCDLCVMRLAISWLATPSISDFAESIGLNITCRGQFPDASFARTGAST